MSILGKLGETALAGGAHTIREIQQQPRLWLAALESIEKNKDAIEAFINENVFEEKARIIFTGAGTSAYAGDLAAPTLRRLLPVQVESIATTDIVASPLNYFKPDVPTVLVSFARSGNSPESVGAYHLAKKLVKNMKQIIITCNSDGQLAKEAANDRGDTLLLLMPEESNDKGFAMTSSFTCMYLSALAIFQLGEFETFKSEAARTAEISERILETQLEDVRKIVGLDKKKVVYLGSGLLKGLAQETSLKNLELAAGKIPTFFETVLGFRHGPKSIVDDETLIFVYLSNDPYTRKYEIDLLKELKQDGGEKTVVAFADADSGELSGCCDTAIVIPNEGAGLDDSLLALDYVIYGQLYAFFNSIHLGITPDNPSPSGRVNRVVKGVTIYDFD
ncbi:SIS domain-containing protein [Bacillus sp. B-jedd]|uniref:SIS domain-containing protein n=1 Tax=Bacillus sp. B-jedd TaxID=1476857 RepID=UPI0005156C27|nr:SIS domain-containing protein [Bacillus sp. B-jedd]CEG28574.1 tagatose-6-phosphate ketose/aldose isomerase [Bacillus sp. B-jedd]